MKTIFDAVNELRGDLSNHVNKKVLSQHKIVVRMHGDIYLTSTEKVAFITNNAGNESYSYICTVPEFKALVSYLEDWQPTLSASPLADVSYAEYKAGFEMIVTGWDSCNISESLILGVPPVKCEATYHEKESKPELVTVEGMQYEIGGIYEFSDNGETWIIDRLTNIDLSDRIPYRFGVKDDTLKYIRALVGNVGKITPAPVELVDGAAYALGLNDSSWLGYYDKRRDSFFDSMAPSRSKICGKSEPSNLIRLVPEVK